MPRLPDPIRVPEATEERRRALYDQGLSDGEIGKLVGVRGDTIRQWRHARNLPPNFAPGGECRKGEARMQYKKKEPARGKPKPGGSLGEDARRARELGMTYGQYSLMKRLGKE